MTINTKNLRTLALDATPGPWECHWKLEWSVRNATQNPMVYVYGGRDGKNASEKDSEYIAACSPDVVLALLDALERKDSAIKKCYGEVIRGLADVVNVHTPDKLFDLDAIPRDPVMAIVSRIKTSMDAITKEIGT